MNTTLRNILIVVAALAIYELFLRQTIVEMKESKK